MLPHQHGVDAFSMQMAIGAGLVDAPSAVWWPEGSAWRVQARSRTGTWEWILTRDGATARFLEHHHAQATAEALGQGRALPDFAP